MIIPFYYIYNVFGEDLAEYEVHDGHQDDEDALLSQDIASFLAEQLDF